VLAWASEQGRILLTHDAATVPTDASRRIREGLHMPGVILIPVGRPLGATIRGILRLVEENTSGDMNGFILYLSPGE
jgi:hypothetical protein